MDPAIAALLLAAASLLVAAAPAGAEERALRFVRDGEARRLELPALRAGARVETLSIDDPYYRETKHFRALALADVLALGFPGLGEDDADRTLLLRARDGYVKPTTVGRLREPGGWIAFADADHAQGDDPGFQPIDRRQVDPAPFYLVWSQPHQRDVHRYPWPYQLAELELAPLESVYPHVAPRGAPEGDPAWAGYAVFRRECLACHAVNGEGGKVGPELNVPRSVVEYRPEEQLKAFIRDPESFRYTSMPAHTHLSDRELDALIAYLHAMAERKHDPGARP